MSGVQIEISYSQVSVFGTRLEQPFNDWSEAHIRQGFAWRPGSVSFATLGDGVLQVHVSSEPYDDERSHAVRVIRVPFQVPDYGEVDIASIGSAVTVTLPSGNYELIFEHGRDDGEMWTHFHFVPVPHLIVPAVLRADEDLSPVPSEFVITAEPA